jgi:hypothetical protein
VNLVISGLFICVGSSHQLSCLGVIFDNCLSWGRQVDKAIMDSRRSLQAIKVVRRYFSVEETAKLVMSLVYSWLYYASEAWLLPTLKRNLFDRLYSQSGKILKVVDKDLSYSQLHKKYNHATPRIFSLYQTCINYYNIIKVHGFMTDKRAPIMLNTMQSDRNDSFMFIRQNR